MTLKFIPNLNANFQKSFSNKGTPKKPPESASLESFMAVFMPSALSSIVFANPLMVSFASVSIRKSSIPFPVLNNSTNQLIYFMYMYMFLFKPIVF